MTNGKVISAYLLFVGFSALVSGLIIPGFVIGAAIGGGIAIIWWIIATLAGGPILLKTLNASSLNVNKYSHVAKLVAAKSKVTKTVPPSLWMIRDLSPMVLSIAVSAKSSHLIFTQGFFERLDDKAQMGIIIRELESIRSGFVYANTGLATLLWAILIPGRLGGMLFGKTPNEVSIVATILNLLPTLFLGYPATVIGSDKKQVYAVDTASLRKLDNPDYLPYGLMKLDESILRSPYECDLSLSGCCVVNPNSRKPLQFFYKLHPPTPKRIDRLRIRADSSRLRFDK